MLINKAYAFCFVISVSPWCFLAFIFRGDRRDIDLAYNEETSRFQGNIFPPQKMARFPSVSIVLVAAHLVSAVGLVWLIDAGVGGVWLSMGFDAMFYADAALVGMWAGLGRHSKAVGFLGVGGTVLVMAALVLGSLWHSISGPLGAGNDVWVTIWLLLFQLALAMLSMTVVVAAILWLRQRGIELRIDPSANVSQHLPPVRFSLRQLFLLMVVTGVLLKLGPVARTYLNDYRSYLSSVVAVAAGGVCLGLVGLGGLWAVFGGAPSAGRIAVAFVTAAVLGLFPPYYFPKLLSDNFLASISITMMQALIVISTLAAVRLSGYRLLSSPQRRSR